jgi:hypothetical protein
VEAVERVDVGFYQITLKHNVNVEEIKAEANPAGFNANPPNYDPLPVIFLSYIGTRPHITGFLIGIGQAGIGLVDHDFQLTVSQIRIVE